MDDKELRKQYMEVAPKLKAVLQSVKSKLMSLPKEHFAVETNAKPFKSIKRKMKDKADAVNHVSELSDLVRGRLFFSKDNDYNSTLSKIKELFGPNVKKIENADKEVMGIEYNGIIHVDLNIDGITFELQLLPIEYRPCKEVLHKIYEHFRNPKKRAKLTKAQIKKLREMHNKLHHKLLDTADENRKSEKQE